MSVGHCFRLSKFTSRSSLCGCPCYARVLLETFAILAFALGILPLALVVYVIVTSAMIILAHGDNIERLRAGTERQLGQAARP